MTLIRLIRRFVACLAIATLSFVTFCQTVIQMEEDGGTYKIPCEVNGLKLKLCFDTGASTVSLSKSVASLMWQNDYLDEDDLLGETTVTIADGSSVDARLVRLRSIVIGGLVLSNVEAVVVPDISAPLLLGQSAIQQLGPVTISGDKLIIENGVASDSAAELSREADEYYYDGFYQEASECLAKLKVLRPLDEHEAYFYIHSLYFTHQNDKILPAYQEWHKMYESGASEYVNSNIYLDVSDAYWFKKDYSMAKKYAQKAVETIQKLPSNALDQEDYCLTMFIAKRTEGYCEFNQNNTVAANKAFIAALVYYCGYKHYDYDDVSEYGKRDDEVGSLFLSMAQCFPIGGKIWERYIKLAAYSGNLDAQELYEIWKY